MNTGTDKNTSEHGQQHYRYTAAQQAAPPTATRENTATGTNDTRKVRPPTPTVRTERERPTTPPVHCGTANSSIDSHTSEYEQRNCNYTEENRTTTMTFGRAKRTTKPTVKQEENGQHNRQSNGRNAQRLQRSRPEETTTATVRMELRAIPPPVPREETPTTPTLKREERTTPPTVRTGTINNDADGLTSRPANVTQSYTRKIAEDGSDQTRKTISFNHDFRGSANLLPGDAYLTYCSRAQAT